MKGRITMNAIGPFERARVYIETHPKINEPAGVNKTKIIPGPCITISREPGARADTISEKLREYFQKNDKRSGITWSVFDKNLIEKVLQDNNLPQRLSRLMEEEKYSALKSMMNELLGGQPAIWTLVHKTTETILQLGQLGNVIIIDRGANVITSKLSNSFHVRLAAPLDERVRHVQELYGLEKKDASEFIRREELDRKDYVMTYFHKDINDPLQYHLVINTFLFNVEEAAELIGRAVIKKFPDLFSSYD